MEVVGKSLLRRAAATTSANSLRQPEKREVSRTMASGQDLRYKAGEAAGQAQVKKDELMDKGRETAQAVKDKACSGMQATKDAANSAADKCCSAADSGANQTGGFLQQTGEQAMSMAQGAAEAVKNTLGIGSGNNKSS